MAMTGSNAERVFFVAIQVRVLTMHTGVMSVGMSRCQHGYRGLTFSEHHGCYRAIFRLDIGFFVEAILGPPSPYMASMQFWIGQ